MKLHFKNIDNLHADKTGFVVALGPSTNRYKDKLEEWSRDKENNVFLSPNRWSNMINIDCDYWVFASTVDTIEKYHKRINQKKATAVYEEIIDPTDRNIVPQLLEGDYFPYHNFFEGFPQFPNHKQREIATKKYILEVLNKEGRPSLQEYLQKITGYHQRYAPINTVALNMLCFAVILGCNPIYIIGIDLDHTQPYMDGSRLDKPDSPLGRFLLESQEMVTKQFSIINESAKNIGVRIYNLSPNSPLAKVFKTVEL